jgi:hypothetical protein
MKLELRFDPVAIANALCAQRHVSAQRRAIRQRGRPPRVRELDAA